MTVLRPGLPDVRPLLASVAALAVGFGGAARADIALPSIIGDHMVLQQRTTVTIWGRAAPGERVCVAGAWPDGVAEATPSADGAWETQLRTPPAGGPFRPDEDATPAPGAPRHPTRVRGRPRAVPSARKQ